MGRRWKPCTRNKDKVATTKSRISSSLERKGFFLVGGESRPFKITAEKAKKPPQQRKKLLNIRSLVAFVGSVQSIEYIFLPLSYTLDIVRHHKILISFLFLFTMYSLSSFSHTVM